MSDCYSALADAFHSSARSLTADPCVFIRAEETNITVVAVYVDDLIMIDQHDARQNEGSESKFRSTIQDEGSR